MNIDATRKLLTDQKASAIKQIEDAIAIRHRAEGVLMHCDHLLAELSKPDSDLRAVPVEVMVEPPKSKKPSKG